MLRSRLVWSNVALPLVVAGVILAAAATTAQAQTGDSVTGGAVFTDPGHLPPGSPPALVVEFHFDAHSGPSGENPTGTATWFATTPFGSGGGGGSVTCLNVQGAQATIGTLTSSNEVTYFFVSGVIGFATVPLTATSPTYCPSEPGLLDPSSISQYFEPRAMSSNVIIHDAPPVPTSKDQCKNGGWQTFGVFKNQGDCVSSVRHQARQECTFIRAAVGRPAFRAQFGSGRHNRHAMRRCIRERMND